MVHFGIDPEDMNPNSDSYNIRNYLTVQDCFLEQVCGLIQYTAEMQSFFPLGLEVITHIFSEARWIDTEYEAAYIQRRYLTDDTQISVDWMNVDAEYGFIITLPQEEGSIKRIEASGSI